MIQQYFTVTTPNTAFSQYLKQIKYKMLVLLHKQSAETVRLRYGFLTILYKYIIQQYFTVTTPNTAFTKYLKQIEYQMLVLVHPQSDKNVRLRWGF